MLAQKSALGEADFVLCCGDDRSDEDMFEVTQSSDATRSRSFVTVCGLTVRGSQCFRSFKEITQEPL